MSSLCKTEKERSANTRLIFSSLSLNLRDSDMLRIDHRTPSFLSEKATHLQHTMRPLDENSKSSVEQLAGLQQLIISFSKSPGSSSQNRYNSLELFASSLASLSVSFGQTTVLT